MTLAELHSAFAAQLQTISVSGDTSQQLIFIRDDGADNKVLLRVTPNQLPGLTTVLDGYVQVDNHNKEIPMFVRVAK